MSTKAKGDVVEDLVALLHKMPGLTVETRARVQVPGMTRPVDVDVLLSGDVAGDPFRIAIECKNYNKPVGKGAIDTFVGNLETLGIPTSRGVFVSTAGYTQGARDRAKRAGIHLLRLEGLDENRMAAALNDALLSVLHYVLFLESISFFPYLPSNDSDGSNIARVPGDVRLTQPIIYDTIWRRWVTGLVPWSLGEGHVLVRTSSTGAMVQYRVVAYAGTIPGTASKISLKVDATSQVAGMRYDAKFNGPNTLQLRGLLSDADADAARAELAKSNPSLVTHQVRVPRIVTAAVFWPPSRETIAKVMELRKAGERITFATVEGRDLSRAWEHFESQRKPG